MPGRAFHSGEYEFILDIWEIGAESTNNHDYGSNIHFCAIFVANSHQLMMWIKVTTGHLSNQILATTVVHGIELRMWP